MRIGASLVIIVVGATLRFAVATHDYPYRFCAYAAGEGLMIVGALGLIACALWMATRSSSDLVPQASPSRPGLHLGRS